MIPKTFVVVLACVMMAGMVMGESETGHIRPKSVNAACSSNSAQVSWEAVLDANLTGYNIYKKAPGDPDYVKANQNLVTVTYYTVSGLVSMTLYNFAVKAVYNDGIASELSDPAICTTG
jgi:hypothetical protein